MGSYKTQKIDLTCEYPCPCRRKGNLKPIVLTEALGCDRCQQIFVVKKDGQIIEQLSSIYQKKSWQWTGNRWKNVYHRWTKSYLPTMLAFVFGLTIFAVVVLPVVLRWLIAQSIISWAVIFLILIMLLLLTMLVVYRH